MSEHTSERRRELAEFLRTRRARLRPEDVGLPAGRRRRTPGLRREELATLAGVSLTWYTWLEQARDITASRQVLDALARVLALDPTERAHLHLLATGEEPPIAPQPVEHVDPAVHDVLAALEPNPAYVTGRRWDLLAYNTAAGQRFAGFDELTAERRNLLWWMFSSPGAPATLTEWEDEARRLLARFRAAATRDADDPGFQQLRDAVLAASVHARTWWADHDILGRTSGTKLFQQPDSQPPLPLQHIVFQAATAPDQKLVIYLPVKPHDK